VKPCRECGHNISEQAAFCPGCGAPYPAREKWDGWRFEYKSEATLLGLPLLHVFFKYRPHRRPVSAKGVIAIGRFAYGVVTISQFGLGVFSLGQSRSRDLLSPSWPLLIPWLPNSGSSYTKAAANWCGLLLTSSAGYGMAGETPIHRHGAWWKVLDHWHPYMPGTLGWTRVKFHRAEDACVMPPEFRKNPIGQSLWDLTQSGNLRALPRFVPVTAIPRQPPNKVSKECPDTPNWN